MKKRDSELYEQLSHDAATRLTDTGRYLKHQWQRRTPEQQDGILAAAGVIALGAVLVGAFVAGQRAADRFRDISDRRNHSSRRDRDK